MSGFRYQIWWNLYGIWSHQPEHGLDLVGSVGVLAEARLADDGHARVVGDLLQGLSEIPKGREKFCYQICMDFVTRFGRICMYSLVEN